MRKIGMLTSGGDYQVSNATMGSMTESLYNVFDDVGIIRFEGGYKELMYADYQVMKSSDFSGILTRGDTILRTSRQPFRLMCIPDENGLGKVETMKHTCKKLKLNCLVVLGGNGSQRTANILSGEGLNVVSLPKAIDNDLQGTDMTFGFQSVVDVATNAIDRVHTTTASHERVLIVEVMGRKVGWLALYAGLAGGADIILFPEVPYDTNIACDALAKQSRAGKRFSALAVAESATPREDTKISKKELKEKRKSGMVYPSMAYEIGARMQEVTGSEIRVTISGHMQRDGEPCACDRVLATGLGAAAARLIAEERYGYMVAIGNNDITQVLLSKVAERPKTVDPERSMIEEAKMMGISFGDE